ncbi:MAG: hypothetical protein ACI84D_003495 [Thalassolituus oleivorans]
MKSWSRRLFGHELPLAVYFLSGTWPGSRRLGDRKRRIAILGSVMRVASVRNLVVRARIKDAKRVQHNERNEHPEDSQKYGTRADVHRVVAGCVFGAWVRNECP